MKTQTKLFFASSFSLMLFTVANACGESTNLSSVIPQISPESPNIAYAMVGLVLKNPASMLVIGVLCIWCWLLDDFKHVQPYVKHISVLVGMSIYWGFTSEAAVPKNYPHPWAVFLANGMICGFIAYIVHRQAIARAIAFLQPDKQMISSETSNQN